MYRAPRDPTPKRKAISITHMTPETFVEKWKASELKERSAAQEHFIDLCHMLDEPTPAEVDPKGDWYCFERGASKTTGGEGCRPTQTAVPILRPKRLENRREAYRRYWWRHVEPRQGMHRALEGSLRYIATTRHARHRIFVWFPIQVLPDSALIAIARDDDTTFGILHSRFHELWALHLCTWLGVGNDPRYTPSTTFETFAFPEGLTPDVPAKAYANDLRAIAIAEAARWLNELRENWLNPPDLVRREPEVAPGYPDRIVPVDDKAAAILKKRTLTNLYNERPAWLDNTHRELDEAVAVAYGWPSDMDDDEILRRLFELNQERAYQS
jgi:hypothetical protein